MADATSDFLLCLHKASRKGVWIYPILYESTLF